MRWLAFILVVVGVPCTIAGISGLDPLETVGVCVAGTVAFAVVGYAMLFDWLDGSF